MDARNAASTGMKPEECLATHGLLVAANYRPTGIKPVVAKNRGKCFTALVGVMEDRRIGGGEGWRGGGQRCEAF